MAYPQGPWGPQQPRRPVTPHVAWYWFGGVLAVIGTLIGLISGFSTFTSLNIAPEPHYRVAAGEPLTIHVTEDQTASNGWELYIQQDGGFSAGSVDAVADCAVVPADGTASVHLDTGSHWEGYGDDGTTWDLIALFSTLQTGEYTVTCNGPTGATFGVLYDDPLGVFGRGVFGLLLLFGVPPLCIIAGIIVIVVTHNRRRRNATQQRGY